MTTQKRRVIYASDEEWAAYRKEAATTNQTVSALIRSHLAGYVGRGLNIIITKKLPRDPQMPTDLGPARTHLTEEETANILGVGDEYRRFNSRPFTPAPKKGK